MEMNSFIGEDSSTYKDLIQDNQNLVERAVIIKRFSGYVQPSGTSTAQGVTPTKSYQYFSIRMEVGTVTGKDIINGGGLIAYGDSTVLSRTPLFEAQKAQSTEADELIIDNISYELVGKVFRVPIAGGRFAYSAIFRQKTLSQR